MGKDTGRLHYRYTVTGSLPLFRLIVSCNSAEGLTSTQRRHKSKFDGGCIEIENGL